MVFVRGFILTSLALLLKEVPVVAGQCGISVDDRYLEYGGTGSIKIPNSPYTDYGNNLNCKWRLRAPINQRVLIYFTSFDLENCCSCDYVKIHDGSESYSNVSKLACGRHLPEPVYSSGRYLYITFRSDYSDGGKGFVAKYRALSNSSGCPSIDTSASVGVIYSSHFPWKYPEYRTCTWNFTMPSWDKITFNFTHFDLEGYSSVSSSRCWGDYVVVRSSYVIKRCGTRSPFIITRYGSVSVTFYSDSSTTRSGFLAFYQKETRPLTTTYPYYPLAPTTYPSSGYHSTVYTCNSYRTTRIYVGKSSGSITIQSPNYNYYYPSSCSYEIDTAEGYVLRLTFVRMSISSCSGCSCGNVQVYEDSNGKYSSGSSLLGKFCNGHYPATVTTRSNKMSVYFYSYSRYDNFQATVISEKEKSNAAAIAVPIVIAVVLFAIIFIVIKCTKVKRSATPTGSRSTTTTNVVSLQTFNAPIPTPQLPPQNTEEIPPSYQEANDHTQGVTNIPAMPRDTGHL
ncbi:unnamed protein product [Porites evermanni]|uniref:CUB domain-containing protein n=1 Tax=Porites evermanni TaxID=104178 RepID=A0ABN8LPR3_9CNID|nr:unnamed protein product [Porites evermanni]